MDTELFGVGFWETFKPDSVRFHCPYKASLAPFHLPGPTNLYWYGVQALKKQNNARNGSTNNIFPVKQKKKKKRIFRNIWTISVFDIFCVCTLQAKNSHFCRITTITLTCSRIPTSVQLTDKNKTGCNSIQFQYLLSASHTCKCGTWPFLLLKPSTGL